jgi:hypothetical protein
MNQSCPDMPPISSVQVLKESATLDSFFEHGHSCVEDSESEEEEEFGEGPRVEESAQDVVDNSRTHKALQWVDRFIFETRRKSGRETENSVLKQWKVSNTINHLYCPYNVFSHGLQWL